MKQKQMRKNNVFRRIRLELWLANISLVAGLIYLLISIARALGPTPAYILGAITVLLVLLVMVSSLAVRGIRLELWLTNMSLVLISLLIIVSLIYLLISIARTLGLTSAYVLGAITALLVLPVMVGVLRVLFKFNR